MSDDVSHAWSRKRIYWLSGAILLTVGCVGGMKLYDSWEQHRNGEFEQLCRAADQKRDWESLIKTAEEWSQWRPISADAWLFLAEGYLQTGKVEKSLHALDQVRRHDPKAVPALNKKAEIEFDLLNRPLLSEQTSLELLQLEPRLTVVRSRLIFFYALSLQRVKLIEQIKASIEYGSEPPDAYVYLFLCDHLYFSNGSQLNSKWLRSSPRSEVFLIAAAVQFEQIMQRLENQTDETAKTRRESQDKLNRFLAQFPNNSALLRCFLHRYAEESKVDDVARILAMVPPEAGNDSVFWRFRGWYQAAVDDLEGAEEAYRKSLELTQIDWRTWLGLAEVLRLKGDLQEAERCQKIALTGKRLRQDILQLPTAKDITDAQLHRISEYAEACGDSQLANHLQFRLQQRGYGG
jgi:cytochrome c-type biogenesis protein CcmH/NrfG